MNKFEIRRLSLAVIAAIILTAMISSGVIYSIITDRDHAITQWQSALDDAYIRSICSPITDEFEIKPFADAMSTRLTIGSEAGEPVTVLFGVQLKDCLLLGMIPTMESGGTPYYYSVVATWETNPNRWLIRHIVKVYFDPDKLDQTVPLWAEVK